MSTCIECSSWSPKATDARLARLGFAQCARKPVGHSMSSSAPTCDRFDQAVAPAVQERRDWLTKQEGRKA